MRIIILTSFLLFYLGFFYEGSSKESSVALSGAIYPFKEMNAEVTLKPVTLETVSPLPESKTVESTSTVRTVSEPIASKPIINTLTPGRPAKRGTPSTLSPSDFVEISTLRVGQGRGKQEKSKEAELSTAIKTEEQMPQENQPVTSKRDSLERQIKNSNSTYFFSDIQSAIKDVTIQLISVTPYQDKEILRFTVKNNQKEFFFISNVTIQKDDKVLSPELYYDPLVRPNSEITCLSLLPGMNRTLMALTLLESGGKGRVFTLKFFVE